MHLKGNGSRNNQRISLFAVVRLAFQQDPLIGIASKIKNCLHLRNGGQYLQMDIEYPVIPCYTEISK